DLEAVEHRKAIAVRIRAVGFGTVELVLLLEFLFLLEAGGDAFHLAVLAGSRASFDADNVAGVETLDGFVGLAGPDELDELGSDFDGRHAGNVSCAPPDRNIRFFRYPRCVRLALVLVAALTTAAQADVDWARGLVTADGVGIADRHAPNPAVARGTSRRVAEDAGRHVLATKLGELPMAGGGTVAARAKDPAVKAR